MDNANGGFPRGGFSYADTYADTTSSDARLCPRQLCGAAVAADDCHGALYGSANRWGPERCDRGMERLGRTGQFVDRLQWKRLSVGGGTNCSDGLGRTLAGPLLREEHFGCRGRYECRDGDLQHSG